MQRTLPNQEAEVPAGRYYLGDPCHVIDSDRWREFCQQSWGPFGEHNPVVDMGEAKVVCFRTKYGDGHYYANDGTSYAVDSGLIGLVPEVLVKQEVRGLGKVVNFPHDIHCGTDYTTGDLQFGDIFIETGENPEDDEDDY